MEWRTSFSGLDSSFWTISVAFAIVFAIVMFAMLRKYEAKLVAPGVSRTLFVLRCLTLLLLLFTLLQPVLTRALDVDKQPRLVVGFDLSESMDTADSHASSEEKLRWAQALGMLGNSDTDKLIEQWVAAYQNGEEPDWAAGDGVSTGELRQRQVQEVFDEIAGMPRTEFVRRLLEAEPSQLLTRLAEERNVDLRVFGAEQQKIEDGQLPQVLNNDRSELRPGGTDVINLLTSSISEEDGNNIQGIVILSDGRQTVDADASGEASRLGALGIPVYCVPIGSQLQPRDLSIASVQVPQTVFLEDTAQVNATITSTGYAGEEVTVYLKKDGEVVDQKTVTVSADYFEVEFGISTAEAGISDYEISTDVKQGELREDNNDRDFTVSVVDDQSHVLIVDGDSRWEFRYLNGALERDKRVDLSKILFNQPYLRLLNRTFVDSSFPEVAVFREQLAKTDILMIGDVKPSDISETIWKMIEKSVSDDGLTLLIIPGRRYMPHQFNSPILEQLLPVSDYRQQLAERYRRSFPGAPPSAFRLQPTPAAADLTLFDLNGPDIEQRVELSGLPGHPWAYTGTAKPVASVWANLSLDGEELDGNMAAIAHQYYGFGQVVWMGVDSTWRWRRRVGDLWHHRFWGQLVRWAAGNKSAAGNDQVRMTLSGVVVDETSPVDVSVRWNPNLASQLKDATVEVIIKSVPLPVPLPIPEGDASPKTPMAEQHIQLLPVEGASERYAARLPELKPGSYEIRLNTENSRVKLDQDIMSELMIRQELSTELASISCNREFLQQLATVSGGQLLEPWEVSNLLEILRPDDAQQNVTQEISLWDHWGLMVLFFVLLTTEWVIRKLHGLP